MLDAFIIEEIKRRDQERSRDDRPVVELPVPPPPDERRDRERGGGGPGGDERSDRGVVIIDFG